MKTRNPIWGKNLFLKQACIFVKFSEEVYLGSFCFIIDYLYFSKYLFIQNYLTFHFGIIALIFYNMKLEKV